MGDCKSFEIKNTKLASKKCIIEYYYNNHTIYQCENHACRLPATQKNPTQTQKSKVKDQTPFSILQQQVTDNGSEVYLTQNVLTQCS